MLTWPKVRLTPTQFSPAVACFCRPRGFCEGARSPKPGGGCAGAVPWLGVVQSTIPG